MSQRDYRRDFAHAVSPERLKTLATATTRSRGKEYHARGRVYELTRTRPDTFEAFVDGTERYQTRITVGHINEYHCTCPAYVPWSLCKHLVAMCLAIEDRLDDKSGDETPRRLHGHETILLRNHALSPDTLAVYERLPAGRAALSRPLPFGDTDMKIRDALASPTLAAQTTGADVHELVRLLQDVTDELVEAVRADHERAQQRERDRLHAEQKKKIAEHAGEPGTRFAELAAQRLAKLFPRTGYQPHFAMRYFGTESLAVDCGWPPTLTGLGAWVRLDTWRDDEMVIGGEHGETSPQVEIALLESALHVLERKEHRLHERLVTALCRDATDSVLLGLDDILRAADKPDTALSIVSWRFDPKSLLGSLAAFQHKPSKRGGYSTGAYLQALSGRLDLLPQDELAFARHGAADRWAALADHPRVFAADDLATPYSVRPGRVSLNVADDDNDVALTALLDGLPMEIWGGSFAIAVDPSAHAVVFARLDRFEAEIAARLQNGATVPAASKHALLERIVAVERRMPVALGPSLRGAYRTPELRLVARFAAHGASLSFALLVEPLGDGLAFVPGGGQLEISRVVDGERRYTVRDPDKERALADGRWRRLGLPPNERFETPALSADALLEMLGALRHEPDLRVEWPKDRQKPRVLVMSGMGQLSLAVKKKRGWFELHGAVRVDEEQIALAKVALALRERKKYVELDGGKWLAIEDGLRKDLVALEAIAATSGEALTLSLPAAAALAELEEKGAQYAGDEELDGLTAKIRAAKETTYAVPRGLKAQLRPYQRDGFQWLARLSDWGIGGCLADDMGLGKTVQAIALLLHRAARGPALVVGPTSVVFNWRRELQRFAPKLRVHDLRLGLPKKLGPGDVVLSSYGMMTREIDALAEIQHTTAIFDEAHALKNPDAQRTKATRQLRTEIAFALTGTPIENRLFELWSLFRLLAPGLLGDADTFRTRFVTPIEQRGDAHQKALLGRLVAPFILRRTKAIVAPELPAKTEIAISVELAEEELALYESLRRQKLEALRSRRDTLTGQRARIAILAALTELRMAACHPRLVDPDAALDGSKLQEILRLVSELKEGGHRALLFSQFTRFLDVIEEALAAREVPIQRLDGTTTPAERIRRIDAFERGEGDVFLISLQAGGTGLNLTSADYAIIVDPWWNPAVEDQAIGRAHRIGQTKPVTAYRLFCRGTLEEKILELHVDKRELVAAVMDNATTAPKSLSGDALLALLETEAASSDAPAFT